MLDSASSSNFITSACVKKLKIKKQEINVSIHGLGQTGVGYAKGKVNLCFYPYFDERQAFFIQALVVPRISKIPESIVNHREWRHINNLTLADPQFHIPSDVDILVGAEHYYEIVIGEKKTGSPRLPIAISSELGWLIGGGKCQDARIASDNPVFATHVKDIHVSEELDKQLDKFWKLEACAASKRWSAEEELCEIHFTNSYTRNQEGRFIVKYPFKSPMVPLGESLLIAIRRLKHVERRLSKNKNHALEYLKFMQDYENLGHMIEVEPPTATSKFRCYLPHHFVLKESSTTTKFRVVFDASAKTSNGVSLNDTMMVGPNIQDLLATLIMRFRKHKVAFTADIEKMYRQILVDPEDQELQHIVWREAPDKPLKHFKLLTITYGTAAGPYLATRVLKQLANLEEIHFPIGARVVREDFYIDDCMSGGKSDDDVIEVQRQVIKLLEKGKMSIRKFTSNSTKVLQTLPEDLRESKFLELDKEAGIKTLGVFWNPTEDYFGFKTGHMLPNSSTPLTKRSMLSEIASLFDPIGWLAPVIISAKILMQSLWKEKIGWDDLVPEHIKKRWHVFQSQLIHLEELRLPRAVGGINGNEQFQYLIGFSDASEQAYCATIYLCTYDALGNNTAQLITSKTRVAPVQTQSLPRLELCGAELLSELLPTVESALKLKLDGIFAYTDSTLTLNWIKSEPYKFNTFVANRISKIQNAIPMNKWGFVSGEDNPADCGSRGISVKEFLQHPLWWHGSPWLIKQPPIARVVPEKPSMSSKEMEMKTKQCHVTTVAESWDIFEKFGTLRKLVRVTLYCLRFCHNIRVSLLRKQDSTCAVSKAYTTYLSHYQLEYALFRLIEYVQQKEFLSEYKAVKNNKEVPRNSKISSLSPFIDEYDLLRVGGRLRNANLSNDQKHPIFIPTHHKLTQLIISDAHIANLHAGPQTLLSSLQRKYWIIRGKDAIRKVIGQCVLCTKMKAVTMQQIMADLPAFRVNPSPPFQKTGIDYAGPFLIRPIVPRSKLTLKAYVCIFICCSTRAIHLELVTDASTGTFIAAMRRFTARRGKPSDVYSDNGTNFVGANRELKELLKHVKTEKHNKEVYDALANDGIHWHFNPPAAPHFGGLWEAGVKSTKYHLRRIMGLQRLTFEEMLTLLTQIEAILNSRPITPESSNPLDMRALTPGHFLIGQPMTALADANLTEVPTNRLVRWQLIQQMTQHFWKRWSSEYISRLQQRPKWMQTKASIEVGAMVIVKEDNLPPLQWKLGRVIQVHPGSDDKVRAVTVKTAIGEFTRPIVKLCLLPIESTQQT